MEQAHHDLGVDEVLGAAERDEAYRRAVGFWRLGLGGGAVFENGGQAHFVILAGPTRTARGFARFVHA